MPYIDHRTNWTNLRKLKFYGFDPCGIKIEINYRTRGFPGGSDSKGFACNAGDPGLSPRSIRSPGGGHGNPLQYSCWRIPWTEEPGGLQSKGSQRVGHYWSDLSCMYARYLQLIDSTQAEQPETQKAHSKLHGDFQPWHRVGTLNPCVFKGQLHYTAVFKVDNQQGPTV